MTINIGGGELKELKPRILVMGVGGAGGNAINAMIEDGIRDCLLSRGLGDVYKRQKQICFKMG